MRSPELKKTYEKLAKWEDALCIELSNGDKSILAADQQLASVQAYFSEKQKADRAANIEDLIEDLYYHRMNLSSASCNDLLPDDIRHQLYADIVVKGLDAILIGILTRFEPELSVTLKNRLADWKKWHAEYLAREQAAA